VPPTRYTVRCRVPTGESKGRSPLRSGSEVLGARGVSWTKRGTMASRWPLSSLRAKTRRSLPLPKAFHQVRCHPHVRKMTLVALRCSSVSHSGCRLARLSRLWQSSTFIASPGCLVWGPPSTRRAQLSPCARRTSAITLSTDCSLCLVGPKGSSTLSSPSSAENVAAMLRD